MKNNLIILFTFCVFTTTAQINKFIQNFQAPYTGLEIIRNQNPYIFIEQKVDNNWVPERKWVSTYNTNLGVLTYNSQYSWQNNEWFQTFIDKDSAILDEFGNPSLIYNYRKIDFPTYYSEVSYKYELAFDSQKRLTSYEQFLLKPGNTWNKEISRYIMYPNASTTKNWLKDSAVYGPNVAYVTHYKYQELNALTKLVLEYTSQATDTFSKTVYTYNSNADIQTIARYQWNEDEQMLEQTYFDSFMYQGQRIAGIYSEGLIFDGTNVTVGPFRYETYSFDAEGNISQIIEKEFVEEEWKLFVKTTFNHKDGKLTDGLGYLFNAITNTWEPQPFRRYSTTPPTGLSQALNPLKNVQIYPNPANQFLKIETNNNLPIKATLTDMAGKEITTHQFINSLQINTTALNAGFYLLKMESNQHQTVKQIVVTH